jgi:hypothetical protein
VPGQVPTAQPPITQKTPGTVPQQPQPPLVPGQVPTAQPPITQKTPGMVPQQPQPPLVPGQVPTTNLLTHHVPNVPMPVTSGRIAEPTSYNFEFIEPGLQSRKVKVYRTNDAAEQIYKDTIPLDQGGFQVIVVGTRNPDYIH